MRRARVSRRAIVCVGEALVDLVAIEPGVALGTVPAFARAAGGAPANVAVGVARLGGTSALIGCLGGDPFGRAIASELRVNGVDVTGIRLDASAHTALAFVAVDHRGEREFLFYRDRSADTLLEPADIDPNVIAAAAILHVGTVSLSAEPSASATRYAVRCAADAHVLRSCDLNLRPALWPDERSMLAAARELVSHSDIVKASADEARLVTGASDPAECAEILVASGARLAIVTCAADGATYATAAGSGTVPGHAVPAIDPTGAGDAFVAALLLEIERLDLLAGIPEPARIRAAVKVANAAGAIATLRRGAIPALPTRPELDALLIVPVGAAAAP